MFEKAVIASDHLVGNLYFSLDTLPIIAGQLEPASLRLIAGTQAGMVYSEMCRLMHSESEKLSAGALEAGLKRQNFDFKWMTDLQTRLVPEPLHNLYGYVEEINNAANLVSVQAACNEAIQAAKADDAKAEALTAALMTSLTGIGKAGNHVQPITAATKAIRERLQAIESGTMVWGALTGFDALDKLMRLVDSELILIAGRPSQGKTQLALQILIYVANTLKAAEEPGKVLIFSTEMNKDDLFLRAACSFARVNSDRLSTRQADKDEWSRIYKALDFLDTLPIEVDDTPGLSAEKAYYRTVMANAQAPVRLVMTDHTELYTLDSHYNRDGETSRISNILKSFKSTARTVKTPWLNCHQLGRDVDDRANKQPMLSDLKYSGEQHGDKILFVHRPEYYLKRNMSCECDPQDAEKTAVITLAKNRNGPIGIEKLEFIEKYARFGNRNTERRSLEY